MPADSDPAAGISLPHAFRPLGVRMATAVLGFLLLGAAVVIWFAFPPEIRAQFTLYQKATVAVFGLLLYAAGYALARSKVVAREDGLTVVNGYRTRRYEWNEVVAVTLRSGGPWATLDISDGTTVAAMGIQGSDGPRAMRQVREIRALVERLTR
jgi:PH (Pleckstrin Homology) domain-containing protein